MADEDEIHPTDVNGCPLAIGDIVRILPAGWNDPRFSRPGRGAARDAAALVVFDGDGSPDLYIGVKIIDPDLEEQFWGARPLDPTGRLIYDEGTIWLLSSHAHGNAVVKVA